MTISTIRLRALRLSPLNARKVKPSQIDALAADIAAHGLPQNLIGYEADDKVMICAGGRRYRALKRLQKDKQIKPGFEVPVDIRSIDEALELSLAENVQREAMHPADAILAYRELVKSGMASDDIAARFGVSIDHVRRLLRLSGLHPKLITAMRRDELSAAAAKELALCEDIATQWKAFKQAGDNPHYIRGLLTEDKLSCGSALFQLVGEDAYRAAGGTITRDLFSREDEAFANDIVLVRSLAETRLAELAEAKRAEGWGMVEANIERPDDYYALPTLYPAGERELDKDEQTRIDEIEAQLAALEEEGVPAYDERVRTLEIEQRELEQSRRFFTEEQKADGTLYLFVGHRGIERHAVGKVKARGGCRADMKPKPDYPAALVTDLGTIRTLAVREAVTGNPELALDILLDCMLGQLIGNEYSFEQVLDLRLETASPEAKPELVEGCAIRPIEELPSDLLAKVQNDNRLAAIRALEPDKKARLLAFCVASQITSSDLTGAKGAAISAVQNAAGLDLASIWTPGAEFFARLSKPVMLKLLGAHCGEDAAGNCKRLKKADLAEVCAERLAETTYYPPCLAETVTLPWEIDPEREAIAAE